jgi:uncharacterized membrane protein YphA (DoxX/SURF4 family)
MKTVQIRFLVTEIISFLFILLFIYAALTKLLDYENFKVQLSNSPILTKISGFIAVFIPLAEILTAVFLARTRFRMTALYGALALMTIFTAYIIAILQFSYTIPCSCGGVLSNMTWENHLVFNTGFLLLAAAGIMAYPGGAAENLQKSRHH